MTESERPPHHRIVNLRPEALQCCRGHGVSLSKVYQLFAIHTIARIARAG
jgi:hypothetical protein